MVATGLHRTIAAPVIASPVIGVFLNAPAGALPGGGMPIQGAIGRIALPLSIPRPSPGVPRAPLADATRQGRTPAVI